MCSDLFLHFTQKLSRNYNFGGFILGDRGAFLTALSTSGGESLVTTLRMRAEGVLLYI